MEIFNNFDFNSIENYIKPIGAIVGVLVTFNTLRQEFASFRRKQELKLDLEILKELKANHILSSEIEKKINLGLVRAFENRSDNITSFLTGLAVFIGFGFWTFNIYQNSIEFNGWIVLTLLLSFMGLAVMFGGDQKSFERPGLFYQLGFYDKANFRFNIILILMTGIITPILYFKFIGLSFWQFPTALFFLIGIRGVFRGIRRIRN